MKFSLKSELIPNSIVFARSPLNPIDDIDFLYSIKNDAEFIEKLLERIEEPTAFEAIFLASPDLMDAYHEYKNGSISKERKEKLFISLLKYYIRSCSRCTPFGLFASLGWMELGSEDKGVFDQREKLKRLARLDFEFVCSVYGVISQLKEFKENVFYQLNTSLYSLTNEHRYIEFKINKNRGVEYQLITLESSEYLDLIINSLSSPQKYLDLINMLVSDEISEEEAAEFIDQLIESQVIIPAISPNVTGEDFIKIFLAFLHQHNIKHDLIDRCEAISGILASAGNNLSVDAYQKVFELAENPHFSVTKKALIQVDTFRDYIDQTISKHHAYAILEAVEVVYQFNQNFKKGTSLLDNFKAKFSEKFEDAFVPLHLALDTENGISLDSNSDSTNSPQILLKDLNLFQQADSSYGNTEVNPILLKILKEAEKNNGKVIRINDKFFEKYKLKDNFDTSGIPFSSQAMFELFKGVIENGQSQDMIYFHHYSGNSSSNLLGRFAHVHKKIENEIIDMLAFEEAQYPGCILAEIAHLPESRIGNVIIRPHLRKHEIPFLAQSNLDKNDQIWVDDLYVGVKNGEIILWSKSRDVRIIPRMTNAHNYAYSSLPIYKFLCNLVSQDNVAVGWSWGTLSNNTFLPRVQYKNVVLSKAQWTITFEEWEEFKNKENKGADKLGMFSEFLKRKNIDTKVFLTEGDNKILLDLSNIYAVKIIEEQLYKRKLVNFEEHIESKDAFIKDGKGKNYLNEIILTFSKKKKANKDLNLKSPLSNLGFVKRKFIPGSEWAYYNIYCGEKTADKILRETILPLCEKLINENICEKYFFIRYSDRGHHIRLRFYNGNDKVRMNSSLSLLIPEYFENLVLGGNVSKIISDTYSREIERYGIETIEYCETIFYYHSEAVLKLLAMVEGTEGEILKWKVSLLVIDQFLGSLGFDLKEKLEFTTLQKEGFHSEHRLNAEGKKSISNQFYAKRSEIQNVLEKAFSEDDDLALCLEPFLFENEDYTQAISRVAASQNSGIFSSIIHMFVNRMFSGRQRTIEMVLYDFLSKYYTMVANSKKA